MSSSISLTWRLAAGTQHTVVPPLRTLPELAALARNAEVVVGVDTGLTHLAAADPVG